MFISDVSNKEEVQSQVILILRELGIKYRGKRHPTLKSQAQKCGKAQTAVFGIHIEHLSHDSVLLNSGVAVDIPSLILDICCKIRENITMEGIFRKGGSSARQKEMKNLLDSGKNLGPQHHVVDVANLLKLFLRHLPDPLIPPVFHDLLLRCLLLKDKMLESILLLCLLLPSIHLNTVVYLMEFLKEVASHSDTNKMDVNNLAIVLAPSIMPVSNKNVAQSSVRISHHVEVVKLLIENAEKIGFLPESVSSKFSLSIPSVTSEETDGEDSGAQFKKKKKRSGSLTRMFNGLRKMVGKVTPEPGDHSDMSPIAEFATPHVKSSKKRKLADGGAFSNKKKLEVLDSLPQNVALANLPFTPSRSYPNQLNITTPVTSHPNPRMRSMSVDKLKHRRFFSPRIVDKKLSRRLSDRPVAISTCGSNQQAEHSEQHDILKTDDKKRRSNSLERPWLGGFWNKKKSRSKLHVPDILHNVENVVSNESNSSVNCNISNNVIVKETYISPPDPPVDIDDGTSIQSAESSFVCISKGEYEDIKKRVSAIENRISQEFNNFIETAVSEQTAETDSDTVVPASAEHVQTEYEKTLEESGKLNCTTPDELARRLKTELKIQRRSLDNKDIRSPSLRKIGTIRRRSRENVKPQRKSLYRNKSWHLSTQYAPVKVPTLTEKDILYRRHTLKRGRPNTVHSGLPVPANAMSFKACSLEGINVKHKMRTSQIKRTQSLVQKNEAIQCILMPGSSDMYDMSKCGTEMVCNYTCANNTKEMQESAFCDTSMGEWKCADDFFAKKSVKDGDVPITGRPSLVKLRHENAGLVMARMKMFDITTQPDSSNIREYASVKQSRIPLQRHKSPNITSAYGSDKQVINNREQPVRFGRDQDFRVRRNTITTDKIVSPKKRTSSKDKSQEKSNVDNLRSKKQGTKILKSMSLKEERKRLSAADSRIRKCNSLTAKHSKSSTREDCQTSKRLPLDNFKENSKSFSGSYYQQSNSCSHSHKSNVMNTNEEKNGKCLALAPLKETNRAIISAPTLQASQKQPRIKEILLNHSPTHVCKTAKAVRQNSGVRKNTPVKVMSNFGTPSRKSPRNLYSNNPEFR